MNEKSIFKEVLRLNDNKRVLLNVGGSRHEVLLKTLNKIPNSRLDRLIRSTTKEELATFCDDYNLNKLEFYFDRDPTLFNYILKCYRTGKIHIRDNLCPDLLKLEFHYWNIENPKMDICCEEKLLDKQRALDEASVDYKKIENDVMMKIKEEAERNSSKFKRIKYKLWNMVDNSFDESSNKLAKVITQCFSVFPQKIHVFPPKIFPGFCGKLEKVSTKCRLNTKK
jgi:hypothetical protein